MVEPQQIEHSLLNKAKINGVDMNRSSSVHTVCLTDFNENLIRKMAKEFAENEKREKYKFNKVDYNLFQDCLDTYTVKCYVLCQILEKLAGKILLDNETYEYFDFTIKEDEVLLSDVDRIIKPLIKNYELALETYIKANNPATYMKKIILPSNVMAYVDFLPNDNLLYDGKGDEAEFVALTEKQKKTKKENDIDKFKKIYGLDNEE